MGRALVRAFHLHGRDHPALAVGPTDHADARGLAHGRAASVGRHGQGRAGHPPIVQGQPRRRAGQIGRHHLGRGDHLNARRLDRRRQSDAGAAVFQQIAQGLAVRPVLDLAGIEAQQEGRGAGRGRGPRTAPIGDQNLLDALGVGLQQLADADGLPLAKGAVGDGRGAPVERGLPLVGKGRAVDQQRLQPARGQGQGQGRAGHARADDHDVRVEGLAHGRHMRL